jgi:hypothetical protein
VRDLETLRAKVDLTGVRLLTDDCEQLATPQRYQELATQMASRSPPGATDSGLRSAIGR